MATYIKLINTPIKEIIFTISYMENVDESKLQKFVSLPIIKEKFPIADKGFNAQLQAVKNQPPTTKFSVDGFILKSKLGNNKLLQARKGSLSFHLINQYENFNLIIEQLKEYWELLESCFEDKLTVNGISVRYLNFIELTDKEKTEELITILTNHPFGTNLENSFTQHRFAYEKNSSININVVTTNGKSEQKDGIILDIILNKRIEDKIFSFDSFVDMREAKNEIFFKCITEKTIKKYI